MKKLDNFVNCLKVLKSADFELANDNDIYRTGVIGQLLLLIRDSFLPAFAALEAALRKKMEEAGEDWT